MSRLPSNVGLYVDGPGKKVRTTTIIDEAGSGVLVQGGSVHDPDLPIAANVKAGGALPNPATDAALTVTPRDLPPNAAREAGGFLASIDARLAPGALVQTTVSLAAGVSVLLIGVNANRRGLRWMVTGANPITVAPGAAAAVVGAGFNYNASTGDAGSQGGSEIFDAPAPTGAFHAISALGSTMIVWELT